jgi:hypothetical protein
MRQCSARRIRDRAGKPRPRRASSALRPNDTLPDTVRRGHARLPADGIPRWTPNLNTQRTFTITTGVTRDRLENRRGRPSPRGFESLSLRRSPTEAGVADRLTPARLFTHSEGTAPDLAGA